ncbi:hypothetical protein CYMTET_50497 [Cymbomonas tetramitiformis]|uniref:U6 small nuclear RNA (adenine-(43)-N(6))-methyltransferase n=1 Tax=Cymbomonas tetramitiformis TaxID=36881 RepID=A0AAE0BN41_9CHLO|nr:hypothetical protein CYMTET_50497 [Cymbomonas tetramitiformis]
MQDSYSPSKRRRKRKKDCAVQNDRMHPRNPYRDRQPDLGLIAQGWYGKALAELLAPYVTIDRDTGRGTLSNWMDPRANNAVTKVLLEKDFKMKGWELPEGYLVPPVPGRLNHVLWAQDLLEGESGRKENVSAIDIGVGASAIYPVLGVAAANWTRVVGVDCNPAALEVARNNIRLLDIEGKVELLQVAPLCQGASRGPLGTALDSRGECFDLLVCNPPFYGSTEEATSSRQDRRRWQDAKDGAAALDDGGDGYMAAGEGDEDGAPAQCGNDDDGEGFLGIDTGYDVAEDCARLGPSRVRWCVVLLGKKSSLATLLKCLEQAHVRNVRTSRFFQGRTVRYGLAWSLTGDGLGPDGQLPEGALEHLPKQRRKLQPPSGEKIQGVPQAPPDAKKRKQEKTPLCAFSVGVAQGEPESVLNVDEVKNRLREYLATFRALPVAVQPASSTDRPGILRAALTQSSVTSLAGDTAEIGAQSDEVHLEAKVENGPKGTIAISLVSTSEHTLLTLSPKAQSLLAGIEGEVTRTNRRWRRLLAKQQQ